MVTRRVKAAVLAAGLLLSVPVGAAATKEQLLYVKARNTRVMKSPSPTATAVEVIQPGKQVTWLGADPQNKQWHKVVTASKKTGYVFQSNLSTQPPNTELVDVKRDGNAKAVDAATFVSTGAAVKALSPGAIAYGNEKKGDYARAVAQIQNLEKLAKVLSPALVARCANEAHLFPVVGGAETTGRLKSETQAASKETCP